MNTKLLRKFILEGIYQQFITKDIPDDISDFITDWKQVRIGDDTYDFMRLGGVESNTFVIEKENVGQIGKASLNDYDKNFNGYYLDNIRIQPEYRRIGLATKLYEYIEDIIGEELKPSPIKQSPEIKRYWSKR